MPQNYGLGRGLSSLIPSEPKTHKRSTPSDDGANDPSGGDMPENKQSFQDAMAQKTRISAQRTDRVVSRSSGQGVKVQEKQVASSPLMGNSEIAISSISANPQQPRKRFNDERLQELTQSIQEHGVVQPLVVTKKDDESFELIAGERRMRAAQMAGLDTVPVVVKDVDEKEKLELAIIENVQRHDLDPIEEAQAYQRLSDEFEMSQEDIAKQMGKSRSVVANKIRLLQLPIEIQRSIEEGKITEGHGKAILSLENPEKQRALFEMVVKQHLTVRQTEARAQQASGTESRHHRTIEQDPQLKAVENEMHELLGTKVRVSKQGEGAKVVIDCYTKDELEELVGRVRKQGVQRADGSDEDESSDEGMVVS